MGNYDDLPKINNNDFIKDRISYSTPIRTSVTNLIKTNFLNQLV